MTHSCVCPYIGISTKYIRCVDLLPVWPWLIHVCSHDPVMCVAWPIHMCGKTHSVVCPYIGISTVYMSTYCLCGHDWFICVAMTYACVLLRLIHVYGMTHPVCPYVGISTMYVKYLSTYCLCGHDWFMSVTMTHSYVWLDSLKCVASSVTNGIRIDWYIYTYYGTWSKLSTWKPGPRTRLGNTQYIHIYIHVFECTTGTQTQFRTCFIVWANILMYTSQHLWMIVKSNTGSNPLTLWYLVLERQREGGGRGWRRKRETQREREREREGEIIFAPVQGACPLEMAIYIYI